MGASIGTGCTGDGGDRHQALEASEDPGGRRACFDIARLCKSRSHEGTFFFRHTLPPYEDCPEY